MLNLIITDNNIYLNILLTYIYIYTYTPAYTRITRAYIRIYIACKHKSESKYHFSIKNHHKTTTKTSKTDFKAV